MGIVDKQGRLFGKVSIIDIVILLAAVVLVAGYFYNRTAGHVRQIIMPDTQMEVTFLVEGVRAFSLDAVQEGDTFFRQHERIPLGNVVRIETSPAYDIIIREDGTAALAEVDGRYNMYITLAVVGSVTDTGYFINGTLQVSHGGRLSIQSNQLLSMAMVYRVEEI